MNETENFTVPPQRGCMPFSMHFNMLVFSSNSSKVYLVYLIFIKSVGMASKTLGPEFHISIKTYSLSMLGKNILQACCTYNRYQSFL